MSINVIEFSTLALAHFVALISPGPDFLLIVGSSFQNGFRKTLWICLGIAVANGLYIALAVCGVSLLRENTLLYTAMKISAAGYLLYLGMLLFRSSRQPDQLDGRLTQRTESRRHRLFARGVLSAVLNPKNAIFYLSLMTLIVSPQTPFVQQSLYGLWMFSLVLAWDLLVSFSVGNPWVRHAFSSHSWRVERASGLLLICVAALIALR